ncbi:hypothetical protein GCM10009743_30080 [Kribbella swartbergensis]
MPHPQLGSVLVGTCAVLGAFLVATAADAAPVVYEAREIRSIYTSELGLDRPNGVAYSPSDRMLVVLEEKGTTARAVRASTAGDKVGEVDVPVSIDGTTTAFDPSQRGLTTLTGGKLVSVPLTGASAVRRIDAAPLRVQEPAGLTLDPSGNLAVLDTADGEIVTLPAGANPGAARHTTLRGLDAKNLRGLAYNPEDRLTYVADTSAGRLYGLNPGGNVAATYDIGNVGIADLRSMTFAPTADPTDKPAAHDLYVADGGSGHTLGRVVQVSLTAAQLASTATTTATLVRTIDTSAWNPPSPDPAGIAYIPSSGRLLVSDSEVEEMPIYQGVNLWQSTLVGAVQATRTTVGYSNEPTGAGFNGTNSRMYISDDDADRIFETRPGTDGRLWTSDDVVRNFSVRSIGNKDAEGVDIDTTNGDVYVIDGVATDVYRYTASGTFLGNFDVGQYGARDPEGIAYDAVRDHLVVVDHSSRAIYEITKAGALVNVIDMRSVNSVKAAGITVAPASNGSGASNFYVVDRGIDNDSAPTENDGKIYEISANLSTVGNVAPVVGAGPDQTIALPNAANLDGTVSDDGRPNPPGTVTSTWSKVSGPGTVGFGNANAVDTTAAFSEAGTYLLRLTADDSALSASDEVTVTVQATASAQAVDVPVAGSSDDAEERVSTGIPDLTSSDLELTFDGTSSSANQVVGIRFTAVDVPRGATITKAYVQFEVDEVSMGASSLTINGEAADNAVTYTAATNDVSSRPRTTATVSWTPPDWAVVGERGVDQQTPDLQPVIQEIVNRSGWASGNAIAVVVNGTGRRTAQAFDSFQPGAPLLHIEYTT